MATERTRSAIYRDGTWFIRPDVTVGSVVTVQSGGYRRHPAGAWSVTDTPTFAGSSGAPITMFTLNPLPSQIAPALVQKLVRAEPATIGHFRHWGFMDPAHQGHAAGRAHRRARGDRASTRSRRHDHRLCARASFGPATSWSSTAAATRGTRDSAAWSPMRRRSPRWRA